MDLGFTYLDLVCVRSMIRVVMIRISAVEITLFGVSVPHGRIAFGSGKLSQGMGVCFLFGQPLLCASSTRPTPPVRLASHGHGVVSLLVAVGGEGRCASLGGSAVQSL